MPGWPSASLPRLICAENFLFDKLPIIQAHILASLTTLCGANPKPCIVMPEAAKGLVAVFASNLNTPLLANIYLLTIQSYLCGGEESTLATGFLQPFGVLICKYLGIGILLFFSIDVFFLCSAMSVHNLIPSRYVKLMADLICAIVTFLF